MATGRCHQRLTPGPALGLLLLWGNALQMHGGGPATTNVSSVISPRHIPKPLLRPRRRRFYFETPFCSPAPSSSCSPGERVELPCEWGGVLTLVVTGTKEDLFKMVPWLPKYQATLAVVFHFSCQGLQSRNVLTLLIKTTQQRIPK